MEYFVANVAINMTTETRTIVPPGAKFSIYEIIIPVTTDNTDIETETKAVFLKPFPNIIAVIVGITINEEISKIPTNRIDAITVMPASTMKR